MGAPLSMLVADIFMNRLEQDIIRNFPSDRCIRYWARCIDEILCVWQGTERTARNLLEGLNAYNFSISFSMEFGGSKIAYLDLLISLEPQHNALRPTFQVHRKPTFTGVSIHRDSLHPAAQKHAVINSAIHRLVSLPLSLESREKETLEIGRIARINGLDLDIRTMIKRRSVKQLLQSVNHDPPPSPKERRLKEENGSGCHILVDHQTGLRCTSGGRTTKLGSILFLQL